MKKFAVEALSNPASKFTAISSDASRQQREQEEEKRTALLNEHEQLSNGKVAAFEAGGAEAVKKNQQRMRDIEDELEICDIALKGLDERIKEATERENFDKVKIEAKQWIAEAKLEAELREKWLKSAVETFKLHDEYFKARRKCLVWRSQSGSPEAQALKPVDELYEQLKKKGAHLNWSHPINNEETFKGLKAAANFRAELEELGVKA